MWRAVLLWACLATGVFSATSAQEGDGDYTLQPGDRVEVSVLEDPTLNRTLLVRPDGRVNLPLAGAVTAEGLTPEQLAARLRAALARDFVQPPTVTAALVAVGDPLLDAEATATARIYVVGEVARPGVYDLTTPVDALQALAVAGGPGAFAARDRIQIRRREAAAESVFLFSYADIERGVTPSADMRLRDGDVIVVPERGLFE